MGEYRNRRFLGLMVATLTLAVVVYILRRYGLGGWLDQLISEKTSVPWFISLMIVLPNFGFPIVAFLILAGAKFGLGGGLLVAAVTMPLHLLVSYLLVHSMMRPWLVSLLQKMGYGLPQVSKSRFVPFTVLFVAIPGPPYAVKNYGLALAGIPFRYYFAISLPINIVLSVPVIGLGTSAIQMDLRLFSLFAAILVGGYVVVWWLKDNMRKRKTQTD